jgi:hypothetical protein
MTEPSSFNPLLDHEKHMIALALTAWDEQLSDPQIATLREIGIDRAGWGTRFGSRLASYDLDVYGIPQTWEELSQHYQEFPNSTLRSLAGTFVRRLHGEVRRDGVDKLTQNAASLAYIDAKLKEAQSERDTDDPMVLALREPLYLDTKPASDIPADTHRQPDGATSRPGLVRSVIWYLIFSALIVAAIAVLHLPQWVLVGYLGIATIGLVMAIRAKD